MKNLLNFLLLILISVLEIQVVYGDKMTSCWVPYEEETTILCLAYIPRYYYDLENDECVFFIYGGCGGTDNSFMTKEDCEKDCDVKRIVEIDKNASPCSMHYEEPKKTCLAYIPRYYYDIAENICVFFIYGGCGGNANNFHSLETCEETCVTAPNMRKSLKRRYYRSLKASMYRIE